MPTQAYTAFISYSHADGEAFAEALKQRIANDEKGKEVSFWYDVTNIHMGTWSRQIETAIEQCEFLIMVITPAALQSPNCKDEWIYARKKGVMILPVNGLPSDKEFYKQFPKWLEPQHIYNLDKQWQRFINDLTTRPTRQPIPFMARRLAEVPNYVVREDAIAAAKKLLLDENENKISLTTSLQGSGGFGKTTLAIALCNDDEVINAFSDGILWVTLGQEPDILNSFKKLYEGLTGEQKAFIDIENARQKLQDAFEKRNCLLVIDDAWRRQDVKPLIDAATGITVLITTRITNLLNVEKYKPIRVDEMKTDEGTKLLTALFNDKITDKAKFREFSKKLGEWPLLLKLAGAQIQQRVLGGEAPEQALSYVQKKLERKGLHALDFEESDMREESVRICMNASIDLLNPLEKDALTQLGIFPEDEFIPFFIIQQLWEMDEFDTEELLKKLERQALLDIQLVNQTVSIHDVLLKYYSENLHSNDSYKTLQLKLINSLRDFRSLKDSYANRNYIWHLAEAGEIEMAKQVLLDFEWLEAKLLTTDINSLLRDCLLVNKEDRRVDLLLKALKSSAYILAEDKNQLPVQLIGRLGGVEDKVLQEIVVAAGKWNRLPWLKPITASMNPPTILENVIKGVANPDVPFLIHEGKIIFADWQTSIHIIELNTGKLLYSFAEHSKTITALLIFQGKFLVSGDGDGNLNIYDLENKDLLCTHSVSKEYVSKLVSYGDFVLGGSGDGTLIVVNMQMGFALSTYSKHTNSITTIITAGNYIISASPYDETLKAYHFERLEVNLVDLEVKCETALVHNSRVYYVAGKSIEVASFTEGNWKHINSVSIRDEGSDHGLIYTNYFITTAKNDIVLMNIESSEVFYLEGHTDTITALYIKDDFLISGSFDKKLKVWSLESLKEIKTYIGHSYFINQIAVVDDSIVSLEKNGQLFFWRYVRPEREDEEVDLLFYAEVYSQNKNFIAYARNSEIILLDLRDMNRLRLPVTYGWTSMDVDNEHLFYTDHSELIYKMHIETWEHILFKKFGKHLIMKLNDEDIITRSVENRRAQIDFWSKQDFQLNKHATIDLQPEIVMEIPGRYTVITQGYSEFMEIRDSKSLDLIKKIRVRGKFFKGITYTEKLLLGFLEKEIVSWDLDTFRKSKVKQLDTDYNFETSFTNERFFAVESKDNTISVFDKANFSLVQTFNSHQGSILAIKVLDSTIISSDYARSVFVWRINGGEIITSLSLDEPIGHIDVNYDHKVVILFGQSGRLYLLQPVGFDF